MNPIKIMDEITIENSAFGSVCVTRDEWFTIRTAIEAQAEELARITALRRGFIAAVKAEALRELLPALAEYKESMPKETHAGERRGIIGAGFLIEEKADRIEREAKES